MSIVTRNRDVATPVTPKPFPPAAAPQPTLHGEPFAVNFARQHALILHLRRFFAQAAIAYLLINAGVLLLLIGTIGRTWFAASQLERQSTSSANITAVLKEIETLEDRSSHDLAQLTALVTQAQQRFPVAGKLAALAKTVPARTWITSIAGDSGKHSLTIQAAYAIDPAQPYTLPTTRWIESLKADPMFSQNLKRLELRGSSKKTQGKVELALLELDAEWGR